MTMTTYERRKAEGRCTRCNAPLIEGEKLNCEDCAAVLVALVVDWQRRNPGVRAASQKRYKDRIAEERRAAGLCVFCGEPKEGESDRCDVCREKCAQSQRDRRAARRSA